MGKRCRRQRRGKQPGDPPRATIVAQDDEVMLGSVWEFGDGRRVGRVCIGLGFVCCVRVFVLCVRVCFVCVCVCVFCVFCVCMYLYVCLFDSVVCVSTLCLILVDCNTFVCSFNVSVTFQCAS